MNAGGLLLTNLQLLSHFANCPSNVFVLFFSLQPRIIHCIVMSYLLGLLYCGTVPKSFFVFFHDVDKFEKYLPVVECPSGSDCLMFPLEGDWKNRTQAVLFGTRVPCPVQGGKRCQCFVSNHHWLQWCLPGFFFGFNGQKPFQRLLSMDYVPQITFLCHQSLD